MSKVNFFTELFPLLEDKESIDLKVQRTGDELTILLVPKIKGKTATIAISGSPEDLNDGFMAELVKPVEKIKGLVSNASEAKIEDVEEEEEELEDTDDEKDAPVGKKAAAKKAAPKKAAAKKTEGVKPVEPVKEEKEVVPGADHPEGKTSEQIEAEIEAERLKEEAEENARQEAEHEKVLAEEQIAIEKAEKEAEEKRKAEAAEKEAKAKGKFEAHMKAGDEAFEARKYELAEEEYQKATELFPENKVAIEKFEKAYKWVNQLINAKILPARKEKGGADGIAS